MGDPTMPPILWWSADLAQRRQHDDTFAAGVVAELGDLSVFYAAGDDGWAAVGDLPADARRLITSGPRADRQCPVCPTDIDITGSGWSVCIECGWTDNPDRIPQLHAQLDELRSAAPPASLPAVLSSVADVARVCEAAGLQPGADGTALRQEWLGDDVLVSARIDRDGGLEWVAVRRDPRPKRPHGEVDLWAGASTVVAWAAIQAARGGEHLG